MLANVQPFNITGSASFYRAKYRAAMRPKKSTWFVDRDKGNGICCDDKYSHPRTDLPPEISTSRDWSSLVI